MNCHGCKQKYDLQCADLSPKRYRKLNPEGKLKWRCFECRSKEPKTGNTNTPLRPALQPKLDGEHVPEISSEISNITLRKKGETSLPAVYITEEKLRDIWKNEMRQEMQIMLEGTIKRTISSQLTTINSQCSGVQESVDYVSTQYEELRKEISVLKGILSCTSSEMKLLKEENKKIKDDLSVCMNRVHSLEAENLKQQQWVRMQNIEITGIPEEKTEVTTDLVLRVAQQIGVKIELSDVEFAHRVQPRRAESAARARPIVVRLRQRATKDQLIAAARKHRNLNGRDLGIGGEDCKVYVNEHLTRDSKILLSSCKQKAKEVNYKFVWTKNCRIFVRKNETAPPVPINSSSDLLKIV